MTQAAWIGAPLDVDEGLARAGGERDFYRELLDLLLQDVPTRLAELRAALAANQADRVARAAHTIKGAAANLSAHPLRDAAFRVEQCGRSGELAACPALLRDLEAEFGRLAEHVRTL